MQRNCRRGQRRALQEIFATVFFFLFFVVDIPYSHLHCCGVSVPLPGKARLRGGLRRSQNAEKLQGGQGRALQEIFAIVFFFLCLGSKKNGTACGRRGLGRYPILRLTSCVPGEARLRGGLRRSQNAEKLQAWAEARAAVSLIGLLAV